MNSCLLFSLFLSLSNTSFQMIYCMLNLDYSITKFSEVTIGSDIEMPNVKRNIGESFSTNETIFQIKIYRKHSTSTN